MTDFYTKIVLDAEKATAQASGFGKEVRKSSGILEQFQQKVHDVTQGGAKNVFRQYEKSTQKLNLSLRSAVASLHSMEKGVAKSEVALKEAVSSYNKLERATRELTEEETKRKIGLKLQIIQLEKKVDVEKQSRLEGEKLKKYVVQLNQRYDENARALARAKKARNDLNLTVAAGLQTKKSAVALFKKEMIAIRASTTAYKEKVAAEKKANAESKKSEAALKRSNTTIDRLLAKYDKQYRAQKELAKVQSELNFLQRNGALTSEQAAAKLDRYTKSVIKANRSMNSFAKIARAMSVATRASLALYVAIAAVRAWTNISKTSEAIDLLGQKMRVLTGDADGLRKISEVALETGIKIQDLGKIVTRFAVATDRAFSIDTMTDWASTIVKSARITGTSTQEMTGALIQITQAMSAGRLMGDEYRSVTENLPLLTVALRKVFGDTTLSLKELSSQGLITNSRIIEAIEELKNNIEGIPGAIGTVEAKINSLSTAWELFLNKVVETERFKQVLDNMAFWLTVVTNSIGDSFFEKIEKMSKNISSLGEALKKYKPRGDSWFVEAITFQDPDSDQILQLTEENYDKYLKIHKDKTKELADFISRGGKTLQEAETNRKNRLAADAHMEELISQKTERRAKKFFESIGGADKEGEKELLRLRIQAIESTTKEKIAPRSRERADLMIIAERKRTAEKIAEIDRKAINSIMENQQLSINIDTKTLMEKRVYSGKIIDIEKKHSDTLKKIRTQRERGRIELDMPEVSVGDTGGLTKLQEANLILNENAAAEEGIKIAIDKTDSAVQKLIGGGRQNNDAYSQYKKRLSDLTDEQTRKQVKLDEYYRDSGTKTSKLQMTQVEATDALTKSYERQKDVVTGLYTRDLENSFSKRLAAERTARDSLAYLDDAQKDLTLSAEEVAYAQEQIDIQLRNSVESAAALTGSYTILEGAQAGLARGLRDYEQSIGTVYETVAGYTEKFLNETDDAFVNFLSEGTSAFDDLGESFKDMIDDMLKDLIRLAAKDFIVNLGADLTSLLGIGQGSSALGEASGGSGDSILNYAKEGLNVLKTGEFLAAPSYAIQSSLDEISFALSERGFWGASTGVDNFGSTLTQAGGGNIALGSLYTAGAGVAGSFAGGKAGSEIFGKEAQSDLGKVIGGVIGSYWGPPGAFLGSFTGGLIDSALGGDGKKRTSLGFVTEPGSQLPGQKAFGESGLEITAYQKRTGQAGIDMSNSMAEMAATTDTGLTRLYSLLGTNVNLTGQTLGGKSAGKDANWGPTFFGSAEFDKVNAADVDNAINDFAEAWQIKVEEMTGEMIDIAPFYDLIQEGEVLGNTLTRVQSEFLIMNGVFNKLGLSIQDVSVESLVASDNIVQAFGSLSELTESIDYYYDNLYSATEKANNSLGGYSQAIQDFNNEFSATVSSGSDLRAYIDALDLTTESGQTAFAQAVKLAPTFVELEKAMASLGIGVYESATSISELQDNLARSTSDLADAYEREMDSKQDYIDKFIDLGNALRSASADLSLSELSPLTNMERLSVAEQDFESTFQKAMTGDQDALANLIPSSEKFLQESRTVNASGAQYTTDFDRVKEALEMSGTLAFNSAEIEKETLQIITDQYDQFIIANDLLSRINESLSLQDAQAAYDAAQEQAPLTDSGFLDQLYTEGFGREADAGGLSYWMDQLSSGASRGDVLDQFKGSEEAIASGFNDDDIRLFANGGSHPGGLRIVGENGPELENTLPSYISSNTSTRGMLDNSNVEAAITEMTARVVAAINSNTEVVGISAHVISSEVKESANIAESASWRQQSEAEANYDR